MAIMRQGINCLTMLKVPNYKDCQLVKTMVGLNSSSESALKVTYGNVGSHKKLLAIGGCSSVHVHENFSVCNPIKTLGIRNCCSKLDYIILEEHRLRSTRQRQVHPTQNTAVALGAGAEGGTDEGYSKGRKAYGLGCGKS